MQYVADLHIHSHYSIATSKHADPEHLFAAAAAKGITLVGTGDLTHPGWRAELAEKLVPDGETGLFRLRPDLEEHFRRTLPGETGGAVVRFVLSGEISSIYKKDGRTRKVHNVVLMPSLEAAERLSGKLEEVGNIRSDGRPILGLDCRELLAMTLDSDPEACFIPAHIWTPHFSVFGSRSGFDTLEHCYGDLSAEIYAVETGLSSDPPMNWRVSALDRFTLVSNSDAHSPEKLAREANLIDGELTYRGLIGALKGSREHKFLGTVEFYPEEGKYHFDGHRNCKVRLTPEQAGELDGRCPVCAGKLTGGVLGRVHELADRPDGARPENARPFQRLVPLSEVLAECLDVGPATKKVRAQLDCLLRRVGSELHVLRSAPLDQIARVGGQLVAEAVRRNRDGEVKIEPGYDGEYGTVRIFGPGERQVSSGQMFFFDVAPDPPAQAEITSPAERNIDIKVGAAARFRDEDHIRPGPDIETVEVAGIALNTHQAAAVTGERTPLAVVAGPGTGKTRSLAARAAWLVSEKGIDPSRIMAVTFTNRAAAEMRQRIAQLLGGNPPPEQTVRAMTLHRFCLDFLSRATGRAVSVADEADRAVLLARATDGIETRGRLREISEEISRAKSRGERPEDFSGDEDLRRVWTAYRNLCRRLGVLDYDDLIGEAAALLTTDSSLRAETVKNLDHLLVDEFQDLNPAQYALIRLLVDSSGAGLFAIGDPNQSIYAFRGADSRIFDRLRSDYAGLEVRRLEAGYRCPPGIADAAAAVVTPVCSAESAPPTPVGGRWSPVRMVRAVSEMAEALAIVREIGALVGGTGMLEAHGQGRTGDASGGDELFSFADIAVIARTSGLLGTLEKALVTEGIPCRLRGGRSFLEHELVRGCSSWLRLLVNPGDTLRTLESMQLAGLDVESGDLLELRQQAAESGRGLLELLKHRISREVPLRDETRPLAEFLAVFDSFRRRSGSPPAELLEEIITSFVPEEKRGTAELSHLRSAAAAQPTVTAFAGRIALARQADLERTSGPGGAEAVTLMTMHAAKGLEFPVVFVMAVERDIIPFTLLRSDPDEERRLLYVAMTRAGSRLYLTSSARRTVWGSRLTGQWSPLLDSLPKESRLEIAAQRPGPNREKQLDLL
ncbi:MAG: AAA family ATPase [Candidatus Glassbacteria bacterium]|nr:AAA family ATPase [Candidatus Glassbacteria bacterium]